MEDEGESPPLTRGPMEPTECGLGQLRGRGILCALSRHDGRLRAADSRRYPSRGHPPTLIGVPQELLG